MYVVLTCHVSCRCFAESGSFFSQCFRKASASCLKQFTLLYFGIYISNAGTTIGWDILVTASVVGVFSTTWGMLRKSNPPIRHLRNVTAIYNNSFQIYFNRSISIRQVTNLELFQKCFRISTSLSDTARLQKLKSAGQLSPPTNISICQGSTLLCNLMRGRKGMRWKPYVKTDGEPRGKHVKLASADMRDGESIGCSPSFNNGSEFSSIGFHKDFSWSGDMRATITKNFRSAIQGIAKEIVVDSKARVSSGNTFTKC